MDFRVNIPNKQPLVSYKLVNEFRITSKTKYKSKTVIINLQWALAKNENKKSTEKPHAISLSSGLFS